MSSISEDYQQLGDLILYLPALEDYIMDLEDLTELWYDSETRRIATTASRILEIIYTLLIDGLEDTTSKDGVIIPTSVVPADESFVAGLEIKKASEELANSGEVCSVCLEGWKVGDDVKYSPCRHCFHPGYVDKWFKINHFCPLCRFDLPSARDVRDQGV
ncbi:E3 ubiquitin-protein ligase RNF126-like [Chenopodium quinoa]|uniref:RING-type E3 ubiquitin transferase n=1 Tax=Chenopodium quinoa TaxID=63459 RepID=A0A803KUS8_CHEQI|nr:E3 ubiquitin-protein ligase RNF126-like [Chenopodium quinoa]